MARYEDPASARGAACGRLDANGDEAAVSPQAPMSAGQRLKFDGDRRWWTVRAATENTVVLTRQAEFYRKGVLAYSVIDWRRGIRGAVSPCPDVDTDEQCRQLADRIERKGSGHYLYATIPVLVASGHRAEVSPSAYGEEAR